MTPTNNLKAFPKLYASESDYVHKTFEDYLNAAAENYDKGFELLQTLPASWYNSLLYLLTEQAQATKVLCDSIFAELQSVLTAGGVEPSAAYTNQLLTAIETITKLNTATASVLGGIKSSSAGWAIAVDPITSTASVNAVDASTSAKGIVQLNDSISSNSTTQAATANAASRAFANGVYRAYCETASFDGAKRIPAPGGFTLEPDIRISVHFASHNTAANPTLEVGSTGAYPIRYSDTKMPEGGNYYTWNSGQVVLFYFDGNYWKMIQDSSINLFNDTLYIECGRANDE